MSFRSLAVLAWLACTVPAAAALAQERPAPTEAELAEARHSFEVGMQAYDAGEFAAAASEFRAAYELTHAADLLFNVYLAEEHAGNLEAAAAALEGYLRDGEVEAEQRGLLERRLERLRARIEARRTQSAPPPETAEERAEDLMAREIIRDSADAIGSPIEPPPLEEGPTPPRPAAPSGPHLAAIGTLVAAGALLFAFAVLAPLSEAEDQALASRCGRDVGRFCDPSETATLEALDVAADVSWIGAAVLGATGLALLFALPPDEPAPAAAVAPWVSPHAAGLVAGGSF